MAPDALTPEPPSRLRISTVSSPLSDRNWPTLKPKIPALACSSTFGHAACIGGTAPGLTFPFDWNSQWPRDSLGHLPGSRRTPPLLPHTCRKRQEGLVNEQADRQPVATA